IQRKIISSIGSANAVPTRIAVDVVAAQGGIGARLAYLAGALRTEGHDVVLERPVNRRPVEMNASGTRGRRVVHERTAFDIEQRIKIDGAAATAGCVMAKDAVVNVDGSAVCINGAPVGS